MRRADRRNSNDDNRLNNPQGRRPEPVAPVNVALLRQQKSEALQAKQEAEQDATEARQALVSTQTQLSQQQEHTSQLQTQLSQEQQQATLLRTQLKRATQTSSQLRLQLTEKETSLTEATEQLNSVRSLLQTARQTSEQHLSNYRAELEKSDHLQKALEAEKTQAKELSAKVEQFASVQARLEDLTSQYSQAKADSDRYLASYHAEVAKTHKLSQNVAQLQAKLQAQSPPSSAGDPQNYQDLYKAEVEKSQQLLQKAEDAEAKTSEYLQLYTEANDLLKFERRSKASIRGWSTRRKRENEKLKNEIAEMVLVLQDTMADKQTAVDNLYDIADRMNRVQRLVESIDDGGSSSPIGLLQKFKRVWEAIQDIFTEAA